jgi:hypothetical protein
VIRPSALVQIISVITRPAPPIARAPRCTRWKSPGVPSTDEYMSIGETTTRLASSRPRSRNGVNIGTASVTVATKSGSRIRSSPWVIRRERVSRLKANVRGSWPV